MLIEDTMAPVLSLRTKQPNGRIRAINGGCLAPPLRGAARQDISREFKELNLPITRLHDAPLENAGYRLVDVCQIFPFWHLDTNDPRNYYFRDTDKYISNCIALGTAVNYRLGTSIEFPMDQEYLYACAPENVEKWIDVCSHIIAHYTDGWGNGFHFDIRYWTIYCEPDLAMGWRSPLTHTEFCRFYIRVAKALKARWPHLKFGGPGHGRMDLDPAGNNAEFLRLCREADAPLDFYGWHSYAMDVEYMKKQVLLVRRMVTDYGYPDAELHLSEWHYTPSSFVSCPPRRKYRLYNDTMKQLHAAAYITGVLTVLQDTPLDMANYYTVTTTNFGLFTPERETTKSYYAMKAFGEIIRYPERLSMDSSGEVHALAGRNENGEIAVLLTVMQMAGGNITIRLDAPAAHAELYSIDEDLNLEPGEAAVADPCTLKLKINAKPSVHLLKITPEKGENHEK